METRQLPWHCGHSKKPDVCGGVRIWQDRNAHQYDRGSSTEDGGARQTPGPVDHLDSGSSPRLHFLGTVRTESIGVERECLYEIAYGAEVWSWWAQLIDRLIALSPLRADAECSLQRTGRKLAMLPLSLYAQP